MYQNYKTKKGCADSEIKINYSSVLSVLFSYSKFIYILRPIINTGSDNQYRTVTCVIDQPADGCGFREVDFIPWHPVFHVIFFCDQFDWHVRSALKCFVYHNWAVTCDFQQCGILTSVDSDEPVRPLFKLKTSKWCSVSSLTLIEYSSH